MKPVLGHVPSYMLMHMPDRHVPEYVLNHLLRLDFFELSIRTAR